MQGPKLPPPKVSIVLPVWDGERFLRAAIESVLRQTFPAFELLVVDDGSTDASVAIARQFADRDSRVVVLREEHAGIAHALNAGLAAARGLYVARMDADDVCNPTRLETQVRFLDAHPGCVAVGSDVEVIDEHGETIGTMRFPSRHAEIIDGLIGGSSRSFAHPAVMMRRDAVCAAGGYRADRFPSEDLDLWVRMIEVGELANIGEPLLQYRRHSGTVGVREGARQKVTTAAIVGFERARRGLGRLAPAAGASHDNPAAQYHFECVRIALTSGNRAAAMRHARATIRRSPRWSRPYAALAVAALPAPAFAFVMRLYERFRTMRRASTSSVMVR